MSNGDQTDMFLAPEDSSWKPFIMGIAGGIAAVIVGHPLDTIKLRFQTHAQANLLKNLYHGVTPNLIATPAAWSFNLFAYHTGLKIVNKLAPKSSSNLSNSSNSSEKESLDTLSSVPLYQVTGAGMIAGFAWSICVCPFEMVKCYAQRYHVPSNKSLNIIYKHLGFSSGIYRGIIACLMRDIPVSGVYFTILETARHTIPNYDESTVLYPFLTGALCGISGCIVGLPGDCIKSHIQTNFIDNKDNIIKQQKVRDVFNQIVKKYGYKGLYRGGTAVVAREILGAGSAIMAMEYVNKLLKD